MSTGELNAEDLEGLVGRELDGRYLLDRFIDRGGFGVVYRGIDKKFNQPVAVKVGLSYREFMKEAKLAAEVRHDNIVQVSDYGHDRGLAYLVMEFLHGDDLEKLFKSQDNRLTSHQLRKLVAEVGDALAHAHADQLIHRDLKPRNIILKELHSKSGTSLPARFVLLDFGIASKMDATGTQRNRTQDGAGTVEYMAPELLKTAPVATQLSDIYAFGTILYQMMMGRVPFPQNDTSHMALSQCVSAILHLPPPPFEVAASDRSYPSAVEAIVLQCLDKDPANRPRTMEEVRDRFLAAFEPTSASKRRVDFSKTVRPGELGEDTSPGFDHDTDVQSQARQAPPQPVAPPSRAPWLLLLLLLGAIVAAAPFVRPYFTTPTFQPVAQLTVQQGKNVVPTQDDQVFKLPAGDRMSLVFAIRDLPSGSTPEFADPEAPPGVLIDGQSVGQESARNYTVSIADLNMSEGELPAITFRAKVPGRPEPLEKSLKLEVVRPGFWMPAKLQALGFREASDARLCRVDQAVYASVIERKIGNQTARFRLVPATTIGDRRIKTFYVMEDLVTNALFQEFTSADPNFEFGPRLVDESSGATLQPWDSGDEAPVTCIYVLEAQRFAQWLAGQHGSLPSTTEWELSAGYYDFLRLLKARFPKEDIADIPADSLKNLPLLQDSLPAIGAEVGVGAGPTLGDFRSFGGPLVKKSSPYGCLYRLIPSTQGVPTEMTSTYEDLAGAEKDLRDLCRRRIPGKNDEEIVECVADVRGPGTAGSTRDDLWITYPQDRPPAVSQIEDLKKAGILSLAPDGGIALDSYIGFRIVISTDNIDE
jgi:eukaryotic-like serine/threonine-protein kinase